MQTEQLSASLRLRTAWEAVDLGFRMVGVWWKPIFRLWFLTVVPFSIAILILLKDHLLTAVLVIWWFKPLYDRLVLSILSEGLFGEVPTLRQSLKSIRLLGGGIWRSLLWARFSPVRGVSIPVRMLEQLRGKQARARCQVLLGRETRVPVGLLFICVAFEYVLQIGQLSFLDVIPYAQREIDWTALIREGFGSFFTDISPVTAVLYVLSMSIIEPFFVGGCFGFYINRRVYLEGWDLDLSFRNLAERHKQTANAAAMSLLLAGVLLLSLARPVAAQEFIETVECEPHASGAAECIEKVMETTEFQTWIEQEVPKSSWDPSMPQFLADFFKFFGSLLAMLFAVGPLGYLTVALAAALLLALIVYSLRNRQTRDAVDRRSAAPEMRFGLDLRPESLPEDVIGSARALFEAGNAAGALSLLYRAALVHIVHTLGIEIAESATEGECVRVVRAGSERLVSDSFSTLTRAWLYCAYAHTPPEEAEFQRLCELWSPLIETTA